MKTILLILCIWIIGLALGFVLDVFNICNEPAYFWFIGCVTGMLMMVFITKETK